MTPRHHKPFVLSDIEPAIAMADAMHWERQTIEPPRERLLAVDKIAEARHMRSAYQRQLMGRLAEFVVSLFTSPRHAVAKVRSRTERQAGTRSV